MRTAWILAAGLVLLTAAGVPKSPPPPIALSEAAETALASGGIHIENIWDEANARYVTFAAMDVAAPPERVIDAAVDLKARIGEVSAITDVIIYRDEPGVRGGEWVLSIMGSENRFSILYEHDRSRGWCYYSLDKSRRADIVGSEGSYQAWAHGKGSRVIYRGYNDSGKAMPGFVTRWLGNGSLHDQMSGIRARAEKAAKAP